MTNLKSERQLREPWNNLSVSSQFPQRFRMGWVNSDGGLSSWSTTLERVGGVVFKGIIQRDCGASLDKLENEVRSTMDRSDTFF